MAMTISDIQQNPCAQAYGTKTILHVEDNEADSYLVKRALQNNMPDATLLRAETVAGAEAILQSGKQIDLILLDLGLPDITGRIEAFSRITKHGKDIPVIVLTGFEDHEMVVGLVHDGADNFIRKSMVGSHPQMLCEAINIAFCHRQNIENHIKEKDQVIQWMCGNYSVQK